MYFAEVGFELGFKGEDKIELGFIFKCTGNNQLEVDKIVLKFDTLYFDQQRLIYLWSSN
jgi:hypothetical protein